MAALVVQSRFAGLKIEDDDSQTPQESQKVKKQVKPKTTGCNAKKSETTVVKKNNNKPQSTTQKKKKQKGNPVTAEQWEQWKQKDEVLVDGNYESELQQAILLSKLDFEEKKDVYKKNKKDSDIEKKLSEQASKTGNKKQKKKNVMSLDQFNDMVSGEDKSNHNEEKEVETPKTLDKDTEFFERVKDETRNELLKDKINDRVRHRKPLSDEVITRVQFIDTLEKKDNEISVLKQDIISLKQELLTVKSRNKKLCNILGQGEMKDKAEVLVEVERLRGVQAELTAEVSSLHTELERERSKNADPRTKDKKHLAKKKNIRFDVSTEAITPVG